MTASTRPCNVLPQPVFEEAAGNLLVSLILLMYKSLQVTRRTLAWAEQEDSRTHHHTNPNKGIPMLSWSLFFLIVAIIAAVLGFTGIAGTAAGLAKILFFVFLVLLVVSALIGALRGRPPV